MRILYVCDAQSVHTRRWAEHFRDQGFEVHVASFRPAAIDGVQVHLLNTWGLGKAGYVTAIPRLRSLAARIRPTIVHAQYVTSYGFVAASAGLHPLVVTAWGSDVLISPQTSFLARWLARKALAGADHVTTVAPHMNAAVQSLGVPAHKLTAAPFGVDINVFRPPDQPRSEPPPLRIISTRNFAPIYDVGTLIEAVHRLRASGLPLELHLVGAGPLREDLETQVQTLGLSEVTTFHGHVNHPQLVTLLGRSHVFVSTALSDGNNISLNEAMACSCFPVATDIAANSQWIEHGRNGLLFEAANVNALSDCLQLAAHDAHLRRSCETTNREIVLERASWQASTRHMLQLYERLANTAQRVPTT